MEQDNPQQISEQQLFLFIEEARKKGYSDFEIRQILLKHNWPKKRIEKGFSVLDQRYKFKNRICIFLDTNVVRVLERRAKKNLFKLNEQVEDIIRRSCASSLKKKKTDENIDDLLVKVFSRRRYSTPKKAKKKK